MPHIRGMIADRNVAAETGRRPPSPPPGTRVYAVGDIHGRLDLLRDLNLLIHADAARSQAKRKVVVYLGDYIDRGPESRAVVEHLLTRQLPGFECVHLMGNHEDILLRFLKDISVGPNWFAYGGIETLASYGVAPPESLTSIAELERAQRDLAAKLPSAHRHFLRGLRLSHGEGDYFFAHAGIRPGVALERQEQQDMLWIREPFLLSDEPFTKLVVHGHTITNEPQRRANRIGIDTGAYATGRLTSLVAEGTEQAFLQT